MCFVKKKLENPNQWYNKAQLLYRKRKLNPPYYSLLDYYSSISIFSSQWTGHYSFFSFAKSGDFLDETISDLHAVLPQDMIENLDAALSYFMTLGENAYFDDAVVENFEQYDEYADEHSEIIADIFKNYMQLEELL